MLYVRIQDVTYWVSQDVYFRFIKFGLPIAAMLAGLSGAPLGFVLALSLPIATFEPTFWALRRYIRSIFYQRFDLPRNMMATVFFTLCFHNVLSVFTFHVVGALVLGWMTSGQQGLIAAQALPYGAVACTGAFLFGRLRHWALRQMPRWEAQSDLFQGQVVDHIRNAIDPRLLNPGLTRGRPN